MGWRKRDWADDKVTRRCKMKLEHAREILENDDNHIGPTNSIYEGMRVITNVYNGEEVPMGMNHYQIFYGDFEKTVEKMDGHQVVFMANCGWFEDEESWSTFV